MNVDASSHDATECDRQIVRTGFWLIGSGLYGALLTAACVALLVAR